MSSAGRSGSKRIPCSAACFRSDSMRPRTRPWRVGTVVRHILPARLTMSRPDATISPASGAGEAEHAELPQCAEHLHEQAFARRELGSEELGKTVLLAPERLEVPRLRLVVDHAHRERLVNERGQLTGEREPEAELRVEHVVHVLPEMAVALEQLAPPEGRGLRHAPGAEHPAVTALRGERGVPHVLL